jgi:hypothetical protein
MKENETLYDLADRILATYENNYEHHFHEVDRKWIVNAMCQCALIFNSEVR